MEEKVKKVCIVGAGLESLPYYWQSAEEVWGVKTAGFVLKEKGYKVDRIFFLDDINTHLLEKDENTFPLLTTHWPYKDATLWTLNRPIWENDYQHMRFFDIENFVKLYKKDYCNNSTAFALICAIYEGYREVHMHGVDFSYNLPYLKTAEVKTCVRHAQCVAYWIGRMEQMGIRVRINPISSLMDEVHFSKVGSKIRGLNLDRMKTLETTDQEKFGAYLKHLQDTKDVPDPVNIIKMAEEKLNKVKNLPYVDLFGLTPKEKRPDLAGFYEVPKRLKLEN